MEKGFIAYGKDIAQFIRESRAEKSLETPSEKELREKSAKALSQHYQSQELLKKMKWKRITWEEKADYDGFSQRIMENDSMFTKCPAFSFMSLRVVRDATSTMGDPVAHKAKIEHGDLTNWLIAERIPVIPVYLHSTQQKRRSAFSVDWVSGEATILDSASAQEILTFLTTIAPRLQSLQVRMEEQQAKLTADVENVRVRLGLSKVKFNKHDSSFWDDPARTTDPSYVTPDEVRQCLDGLLQSALAFRWYFKGHELRIVKANKPYSINSEKKEIELPSNFAEFSWLPQHRRWQTVEKFVNAMRSVWWLWFSFALLVVGDLEVI